MQPYIDSNTGFYDRCVTEVNVTNLFFPAVRSVAARISFAAWLAFACAMDDILETLPPDQGILTLKSCAEIVRGHDKGMPDRRKDSIISVPLTKSTNSFTTVAKSDARVGDARITGLATALYAHCKTWLSESSAFAFFSAVTEVLQAHVDEIRFAQGDVAHQLPTYMGIRARTIALNPFFEVIKTEYLQRTRGIDETLWQKLQGAVNRACGLQNDLIGLERDLENNERMNAVSLLMISNGSYPHTTAMLDNNLLARCLTWITADHNDEITNAIEAFESICRAASDDESVLEVARSILMMTETHMQWCASAKRYRVQDNGVASSSKISNLDQGLQHKDSDLDQPCSGPVGALAKAHMVETRANCHGLPAYPLLSSPQGLTAIVTGATGVSGYHMAKVLTASPHWIKIYCLSSRPPPRNFFSDLGDGAARVEHLRIDFLDNPKLAEQLCDKIKHVYVSSSLLKRNPMLSA